MSDDSAHSPDAAVSVIVRAIDAGDALPATLRSVFRQTHAPLQVIVAHDGRADVEAAIDSLPARGDGREIVRVRLDRRAGRAELTNAALARATGALVAYADAGDLLYDDHVERLRTALSGAADAAVAFADHYRTFRRADGDGRGRTLGKTLIAHARFDPLHLCRADCIPLTSLMHRRSLLERSGACGDDVLDLVDWDLARRMAFQTHFLHSPHLTAERCTWVSDDGRICDTTRRRASRRLRDRLVICTRRPPKPWAGLCDLSIVLTAAVADDLALKRLRQIWRWTFTPYEVVLALPPYELAAAKTEMPNLVRVMTRAGETPPRRFDQGLAACRGDYVAVVPPALPVGDGWVEGALHALIHYAAPGEGILLEGAREGCWSAVLAKGDLLRARRAHPGLSVPASLAAAGVRVRPPAPAEMPFRREVLIAQADELCRMGDGLRAAQLLERAQRDHPDDLSLRLRRASALYLTGRHDEQALALCHGVNARRPTVDSLLLEAKLHRRADRIRPAVELLERSRELLNQGG